MDMPMEAWNGVGAQLMSLWLNRFYIYSCAAFGISLWFCIQFIAKVKKQNAKHLYVISKDNEDNLTKGQPGDRHISGVKIFYGSQTGTAQRFASILSEAVVGLNLPAEVIDMRDYDPDDSLEEEAASKNICVFLVATYTDGKPTDNAAWFCKWLEEAANDFRVGKKYLKSLQYAVFGLGNSLYTDHYNTVGRSIDRWLWMLGASRILSCAKGDSNVSKSKHGSVEADFEAWKTRFLARLQALCKGQKKPCSGRCKQGRCGSKRKGSLEESDPEQRTLKEEEKEEEELFETTSEEESGSEEGGATSPIVDVEDLGKMMGHMKKAQMFRSQLRRTSSVVKQPAQSLRP